MLLRMLPDVAKSPLWLANPRAMPARCSVERLEVLERLKGSKHPKLAKILLNFQKGRNGFSAARFSVPGFPFMFFLYTVFHFAVFPVAWFSLHRFYLFHQAFYHLNQAFFNHAIWREVEAIALRDWVFLLEFRVFLLSYREILASILFFSWVFESFSY